MLRASVGKNREIKPKLWSATNKMAVERGLFSVENQMEEVLVTALLKKM